MTSSPSKDVARAGRRAARFGVVAIWITVLCGSPPASGAPPESAAHTAVVVATGARQPSIAVAPDGAIHVAFLRRGDIVVATSKDRGVTFGEPVVALDAQGTARGGRQRGPRIVVDARGTLHVTAFASFDPEERAKRYPAADLWLVESTDGGRTWSRRVRVNEVEKQAPESLHSTAVSADGKVFVAWLDRRERKGAGQDLYLARAAGGVVERNRRVASDICECCAPGLAVTSAGDPVLVWREGTDAPSREVFSCRSHDGGKTFGSPVRVNVVETKEDG